MLPILLAQVPTTEPPVLPDVPVETVLPDIPVETLPPAEIPSPPTIPITLEDLKSFLDSASSSPEGLTQPCATVIASLAVLLSGLLVYLTGIWTRRQTKKHFKTSHDLEVTRGLRDRFTTIAGQLADPASAVRTAGVYAMEALANDWLVRGNKSEAQACINVLCSYIRTPYAPPQGLGQNQTSRIVRNTLTDRIVEEHYEYRLDDREIRQSIILTIVAHLKSDSEVKWSDLDFDFTGAHLNNADFSNAIFNKRVSFERAKLLGSSTRFTRATFASSARFGGAQFYSDLTTFVEAKFLGPYNNFSDTKFKSKNNIFDRVEFSSADGITNFRYSEFEGEDTSFEGTLFKSRETYFIHAKLHSARTWFSDATFDGSLTSFQVSTFVGEVVSFDRTIFRAESTTFEKAEFSSASTSFTDAEFLAGSTRFAHVKFNGYQTSFDKSKFGATQATFLGAEFNNEGGTTFYNARFIGGRIKFSGAIFTKGVSFDQPEVWVNVEFDWSAKVPNKMKKMKPENVSPDVWPPALMAQPSAEDDDEAKEHE
ncbi:MULTISPECIES: pentapeptide repeat-containing protein [Rhodococcus]|uniref:pentapeptide repeat-containing protein n=1 Tax=Rhodococcus TaxID=1827 RepID=UPI0007AE70AF|nr:MULTISPECIES: pentapeptide repeat-containing protein [Rhodococcus]KZL30479.1 hypothetical protein A3852_23110 [Rhodococcus qingshengii]MCE4165054.1 hypothetical protein [Rhodococcus sp. Ni2]